MAGVWKQNIPEEKKKEKQPGLSCANVLSVSLDYNVTSRHGAWEAVRLMCWSVISDLSVSARELSLTTASTTSTGSTAVNTQALLARRERHNRVRRKRTVCNYLGISPTTLGSLMV